MADHDAVLFDLDGVLVDSRVPFAQAVNAALVAQGLPPRPEHELHQHLGPPLHHTFHALVGEEALVQPCVDAYRARYRELAASETTVFPGIRDLLNELSEHLPLLIATSKPYALAEPLLDALDLRRFFLAVIGPNLDSENEQKAITIERALRQLAASARPVMVGDRKHDIRAAHEHNIPAIGVLWGIGSKQELLAAGANALAHTPAELATLLGPSTVNAPAISLGSRDCRCSPKAEA
jgi:phosphoglycolate phosphatase